MQLLDWSIIGLYFILSAAIGIYYAKRAGSSTQEFFLSGRNLPWWLAGTTMVATTFAADTPLAVTELVRKNGIAGNWLWWNALFGGMLTVFFFARLWRRAGIMTDVEFVEIRYSGKPAAFLRGFRALYLGILMNCVVLGWVNLAMASILEGMFGIPKQDVYFYVGAALIITAIYSAISGLWGVSVTDAFQFCLAMGGCIILAVIVVTNPAIGGLSGLVSKLQVSHPGVLKFTPIIGQGNGSFVKPGMLAITFSTFFAWVAIQWWSSWYPGAEPGGGGYIAQRMMSAKDEKHSLFATLWFQIAHYCVRPWPWILVALASLIFYPQLPDDRMGFVYAMRDHLPVGLKGVLVAAFFAAYMSTIATQLNWGASYIVNDFYKRFFDKSKDEKKAVWVSRAATLFLMGISLVIMPFMDSISGAWNFLLGASAGIGMVLILRWFWWRINAWSEITAMIVPLFVYAWTQNRNISAPENLYYIVPITTVCWLIVTYLTKPSDNQKLIEFYTQVHPGGIGWKPIAKQLPHVKGDTGYPGLFACWISGIVMVYSVLFGVGYLILGNSLYGMIALAVSLVSASVIYTVLSKRGFESLVK